MEGQDIFGLVASFGVMLWLAKSITAGIKRGDMKWEARNVEYEEDDDDEDDDYVTVRGPKGRPVKVRRYR